MFTTVSPATRRLNSSERSTPPPRLLVEELSSGAAFEAVRPEWEALCQRAVGATPFHTPQWLLPWWRHVGCGELMALALRHCDEARSLAGLLPLYVFTDPLAPGRRHLFPVGIATTDYLGGLVEPGGERATMAAVAAHLACRSADWDVLEIPQLRRGHPLLDMAVPPSWRKEVTEGEPNPVLSLHGPPQFPDSMRDNLRYYARRAARAGSVAYETATAETLPALLDAFFRLHTRRWSQRDSGGVMQDPAVLAHHRNAAPRLLAAGLLRLHALRLDGEPIAVAYCLADSPSRRDRRHYYYLGGFDPRFGALSPGTLIVARAIEAAAAEGAVAFDFLRGREAYKYRFGAVDQPMYTLRVWHDRRDVHRHNQQDRVKHS